MKRPEAPRVSGPVIDHVEPALVTRHVGLRLPRPAGPIPAASVNVETEVLSAFDQYASRLNGFARAAVRDPGVAEDVVQEAFLRLIQELQEGRRPDQIGPWLFRVCGNLIVSRGRRAAVASRMKSLLVDRRAAPSPEDEAIRQERDRVLALALARLPADARVALLLAAKGVGAAEIGIVIDRSHAATRTYICRSRLRLREILAELGIDGAP